MNKYKVEFIQEETFVVDVLANDEQEATDKASKKWNKITENGMQHYHQVGDSEMSIGTVYNVTNTDDPFNP